MKGFCVGIGGGVVFALMEWVEEEKGFYSLMVLVVVAVVLVRRWNRVWRF